MTSAPYSPGQPVAFTDAAGRRQGRINDLTIESVRLEVCTSIASYWCVTAAVRAGRFEGGAHFFDATGSSQCASKVLPIAPSTYHAHVARLADPDTRGAGANMAASIGSALECIPKTRAAA